MANKTALYLSILVVGACAGTSLAQDIDIDIIDPYGEAEDIQLRLKVPRDERWFWPTPQIRLRSQEFRLQSLGENGFATIGRCDASTYDTLDSGRVVPRWICRAELSQEWAMGLRLTPCLKEYAVYPNLDYDLTNSQIGDLLLLVASAIRGEAKLVYMGRLTYDGLPVQGTPFGACEQLQE